MKHWFIAILTCFLFLLPFSLSSDLLPSLVSRMDPIDPTNLHETHDTATTAIFNNQTVTIPPFDLSAPTQVLGDTSAEKRVEVDLTTQHLYAFEGDTKIYDFVISSGTWGRTHPGEYTIWAKVKSQKMSGGSKELGTYFYLPNVPYIMFMYNDNHEKKLGYSLHGAYWHNNFGIPMSHGCINMKPEEAKILYYWITPDLQDKSSINASDSNPGTKVIIYGKYEAPLSSRISLPKFL